MVAPMTSSGHVRDRKATDRWSSYCHTSDDGQLPVSRYVISRPSRGQDPRAGDRFSRVGPASDHLRTILSIYYQS